MGQFVNPDNELFKDSLNSEIYVDKSLIIEKLNNILDTQNDFICVSRPRRFGKTMATSLITAFHSKDDVFTYLIHLGYLTYDKKEKVCWIPNREIASEWVNSIENEKDYSEVVALVKKYLSYVASH